MARTEAAPWLDRARSLLGVKEIKGKEHNQIIVDMFADVGHDNEADETAWCAAFTGHCLRWEGMQIPPKEVNLMARSYLKVGRKLDKPVPGAVVVKPRGKPPFGHVGIVEEVHEDGTFTVIAGNSSNIMVKREKWKPSDPLPGGIRWPIAETEKPPVLEERPIVKTAVRSKSVWAQVWAMVLVWVGYVTDWLTQAWEQVVAMVALLPSLAAAGDDAGASAKQIAAWFEIPWSQVGMGAATVGMLVVLVRHIQDKRRVEWD